MIERCLLWCLVLSIAACANAPAPRGALVSQRVILLPSENGHTTSVVVKTKGTEVQLSTPYLVASVRGDDIEKGSTTAEEVDQRYRAVIAAQPRKPKTFTVFFGFGTDEFTDVGAFEQVKDELAAWPAAEVVITGHTDRVGTQEYNDALSLRRAAVVAKRLIAAGVPAERISVTGRGEREPLVPTEDEVTEPRNRRVELKVR